jgi:LEA14-like dessication related protein
MVTIASGTARVSVILAVSALALGACSTQPPRFTVADIAIGEATAEATILRVTVVGENVNKEPLPLYEIRYSMAIDGEMIETARRSPEATIPAKGTQAFVFPVAVPAGRVDAARLPTAEYRVTGSVTYELPGTIAELFFDSNIRRPSQGFTETGSFAPEAQAPVSPAQEAPPAE